MALSKIQSESVNLADNFAFTGTVTGAGSEGLVHLETQTGTSVASVIFGNDVVNINNYKRYKIIGRTRPATDNVSLFFNFLDASENNVSTTAYRRAVNSGAVSNSSAFDLSLVIGATNDYEAGAQFEALIDIQHIGNDDFQAMLSSRMTKVDTSGNLRYALTDGMLRYDTTTTQPAGFKFYYSGSANHSRVTMSLFGVTES